MAVKTVEIDNLINGQLYGFRMFPRNLKGQYQTRDDKGTATVTPVAFQLPTYTGQHAIFGDINEGRIEMYTSGTLALSAGTYDIFAVGGGGASGKRYAHEGGGGGGYTSTSKGVQIIDTQPIDINIGSGGDYYQDGGDTIISLYINALGGKTANALNGGAGGSGGGCGSSSASGAKAGDGGSNGSDGGSNSYYSGGKGQGTTTRAFGEPDGTLYAGGGGGFQVGTDGQPQPQGGAGGGGTATNTDGGYGTPNTGGGGAGGGKGGSGIAIIRWKRK